MTAKPILDKHFYHDGRGPELQKVIWQKNGKDLLGFEYFNPDDEYSLANLKHIRLDNVIAYSKATVDVHGCILANTKCVAAIFEVPNSNWLPSLNQNEIAGCKHFQIMFYDEIYDVVCKSVITGKGNLAF
ncbi:hypothetical protein MKZ42_11285 [Pseudoalteromonas shioyasakiensis]|uniref:YopX protein domain-containing protein n=1 Tax=Pseudoalteromonas shioyasakiensis TaxID=1190813 RepID=A0ABT6TXS9_9GAMM|nr:MULTISPECIES: hypothetical protein [Pseudoalteromonas]MDI4668717.1 hypothetical protein [Pseudoalteromonas shioyasakiensis]MDI4673842.1 hypothetical protein [Pseudoalteromonas shioyasakiensis]MDI4685609.1 hypothetical protein [Pseudoalteromonas shioyasakiensis]MDI4703919.1 hypothetical protein [Pseudoalteromonas shioyasakiensis]NUJ20964.1 hypothetical protein [Pseudoalteromonas sp. 0802]